MSTSSQWWYPLYGTSTIGVGKPTLKSVHMYSHISKSLWLCVELPYMPEHLIWSLIYKNHESKYMKIMENCIYNPRYIFLMSIILPIKKFLEHSSGSQSNCSWTLKTWKMYATFVVNKLFLKSYLKALTNWKFINYLAQFECTYCALR